MTGEWLAYCSACPVPEIANVFGRAGIDFHQITDVLGATREDDPACWDEVDEWIEAARVQSIMERNRLGLMGHYYGGMLDIYSDLALQLATFGGHIEILEVDELAARLAHFHQTFDVQDDCEPGELERALPSRLICWWTNTI